MSARFAPAAVLCLFFSVACGGRAMFDGAAAGGSPGASGSPGAAGSASSPSPSGGQTSSEPDDGGDRSGCEGVPPPGGSGSCVQDCSVHPHNQQGYECVAGAYRCPAGLFPASSCAITSCAQLYSQLCCNGADGHAASPTCTADGSAQCQPGWHFVTGRAAACAPEGLGVINDCNSLQGKACANFDHRCEQGSGCGGTTCVCEDFDGKGAVWQCFGRLC